MDKDKIKATLFWNNIPPNTNIIGSIINIDYYRNEGLFWVQYPTHLKSLLNNGRHRPNVFLLSNLKDKSYNPKIGEYISCNYIIGSCGKLIFINIELDLVSTRKFLGSHYRPLYTLKKKSYKTKRGYNHSKKLNSKKKCSKGRSSMSMSRRNSMSRRSSISISKIEKVPRVFLIMGHSFECEFNNWVDEIANKDIIDTLERRYLSIQGYHEDISNNMEISTGKQHQHFKKIEKDYKTLLNGKKVKCHIYPEEDAKIFCGKCFDLNYSNYFYSDKCIIADKGHLELNNYVTINEAELSKKELKEKKKGTDDDHSELWDALKYRIDLKSDFKKDYPVKKITYMNGQLAGRSGLTQTSFDIMHYMQKWSKFREQIYKSKIMKDMTKLDEILNKLNKKHYFHANRKDTLFSIYPRKNKSSRIITGPKDGLISFYPSDIDANEKRNEFLNGSSWPVGIYELPLFDINETQTYVDKYNAINNLSNYKFDKLFNNNLINEKGDFTQDSFEQEWKFFSILKKTDERKFLNRAFLLDYPKLKKTKEQRLLTSWHKDIKEITKYNEYLMKHIDSKFGFNPHKDFLLSDLIKNILRIGNVKKDEEVIIISNVCRGINFQDRHHYYTVDQSLRGTASDNPEYIHDIIKRLRQNSLN